MDIYTNSDIIFHETPSMSLFLISHKIPKIFAYVVLFVISIFGNTFIVWTIYKDRRLKTAMNHLVANMAVSDLLVSFMIIPPRIGEIVYEYRWLIDGDVGLVFCKLWYFVINVPIAVSMYTCVFIAIDRYYGVACPLQRGFRKSTVLKRIIPGLWVLSALLSTLVVKDMILVKRQLSIYCTFDRANGRINHLVQLGLMVGLPVPIISMIYMIIVCKLHNNKPPGHQTSLIRRQRNVQNKNVLKMSITIITALYISWVLYLTYELLYIYAELFELDNKTELEVNFIVFFLLQISFLQNFFIYLVFNKVYSTNFKTMVRRCYHVCC